MQDYLAIFILSNKLKYYKRAITLLFFLLWKKNWLSKHMETRFKFRVFMFLIFSF